MPDTKDKTPEELAADKAAKDAVKLTETQSVTMSRGSITVFRKPSEVAECVADGWVVVS